jgi:AraC-like DNA-binding protein
MNTGTKTDIIGMFRHLVYALKAFAKIHDVELSFHSEKKQLMLSYDPEEIINVVIKLICRLVTYTPANQSVLLKLSLAGESDKRFLAIFIHVTGINLSRIGQLTKDIKQRVSVQSEVNGGTLYELQWQLHHSLSSIEKTNSKMRTIFPQILPNFYAQVRKHLQSHFTKTDNLIASLNSRNPKNAAFLKKVNTLILTNIDKDGFNANHLSTVMGMSRTQLYRKLQPIIRQAPGCYIQTIRIQKAKELLETTDMRVGEVAFKTGFQTPSHFTRIFVKHYGVRPSIFCRKTKM